MQIIETIELLSERIEPPVTELSVSDYSLCNREMWFKYRNVKPVNFNKLELDIFNAKREAFLNWLSNASTATVVHRGAALSNGTSIDGILKDGSDFSLIAVVESQQYNEALILEQLYLSKELSKKGSQLTKCAVFVLNNGISSHVLDYDEDKLNHIKSTINAVQAQDEIPEKPEQELPMCSGCEYRSFCYDFEIASINCRTCAEYSEKTHCTFGSSVCEKHLYHPQLMALAGYNVVGADQGRRRIEYEELINVCGDDLVQGKPNFTSWQLYSAAGKDMLQDETLLNLMREFDGRFG